MDKTNLRISWSFGELEANLAVLHHITSSKRTAFQARLKHLHRLGYPRGFLASQGKASHYYVGAIFQMAFALELIQCGFPPEKAIALIKQRWWALMPSLKTATAILLMSIKNKAPDQSLESALDDIALAITPMALIDLTTDGGHDGAGISTIAFSQIVDELALDGDRRRLILLNLSDLVRKLASFPVLGDPANIGYQTKFIGELDDWLNRLFSDPNALDHEFLHDELDAFDWERGGPKSLGQLISKVRKKLNKLNGSCHTDAQVAKYMIDFGYLREVMLAK